MEHVSCLNSQGNLDHPVATTISPRHASQPGHPSFVSWYRWEKRQSALQQTQPQRRRHLQHMHASRALRAHCREFEFFCLAHSCSEWVAGRLNIVSHQPPGCAHTFPCCAGRTNTVAPAVEELLWQNQKLHEIWLLPLMDGEH